jgi:hypothetical protein
MPFFRLAVCRFQPNSLHAGVSLSRISTIDIVQPLPSRTLTLVRHAQDPEITVTLWGRSYLETNLDLAPLVKAQVFTAEPVGGALEGARWRPVAGAPEFTLVRNEDKGLWTAKSQVPPPAPGHVLRLLVVEREQLKSPGGPSAQRVVHVGAIDL